MHERWGTRAVSKARAPTMWAASRALDLVGVLDRSSFMERYTTVVGRTIYCPFVPGTATRGHDLWSQLVVGVHEHQHVVQLEREGRVRYSARYMLSPAARAVYEAEAYTCNLELYWWRYGEARDPGELARRLADYGVRARDMAEAERVLRAASERIVAGELVTEASQFAVAWLASRDIGVAR